jgi:Tfp pilus assembly protein PilV
MRIRLKCKRPKARLRASIQALLPQQGFALIEVMIGGCILGFSVVSLYSAYSYGFALIRLSQENVRADQILVQKLETLRLYNWSQAQLTNAVGGVIPDHFTDWFAPGSTSTGAVYTGTIAITGAPFSDVSYTNTLRQVTVNLNWLSGKVNRTRSMSTLVSQNGIQTYKP